MILQDENKLPKNITSSSGWTYIHSNNALWRLFHRPLTQPSRYPRPTFTRINVRRIARRLHLTYANTMRLNVAILVPGQCGGSMEPRMRMIVHPTLSSAVRTAIRG